MASSEIQNVAAPPAADVVRESHTDDIDDLEAAKMGAIVADGDLNSGIARAEAMTRVWGTHGRIVVWMGICTMLIV